MNKVYNLNSKNNEKLSAFGCPNEEGIRLKAEETDYRDTFFRDIDRVLYSLSFIRYANKTQVFSLKKNNHIQQRMIHVLFVSKIARTIGRALNLNEDLIEAAALGHDLGHVPFGHFGENILNRISMDCGVGYFHHNVHSVRLLMNIEKYGQGQNLNYQVLDAIMCHNGEIEQCIYRPKKKSPKKFLEEYELSYKKNINSQLVPGTLEGCVVRISDIIAYVGRDLEDGLRLNLIKIEDIPENIKTTLGVTNKQIINTLVSDIISNSHGKNYIKLSENIFNALEELKSFNYEHIYSKAYTEEEKEKIENMFDTLFAKYMLDLKNKNYDSLIYKSYLNNMSDEYNNNSHEQIVIDYIAGMTDSYFKEQYDNINKN